MRGTAKLWCLSAGLVAAVVWPGAAFAASSVTGTVTFDGKVPNLKPLAMDADRAILVVAAEDASRDVEPLAVAKIL